MYHPLFIIRSYTLDGKKLIIKRLVWVNTISLDHIQSAEVIPCVMSGSMRVGIGGIFVISGYYQNKMLGNYEAWVTDIKRTVVIRLYQRTVVISPDDPNRFVEDIHEMCMNNTS